MPAFYAASLAPYLEGREKDRRGAVANFALLVGPLGALALAVLVLGPFGGANREVAAVIAGGAVVAGISLVNRTRRDIAGGLLGMIAAELGFDYRAAPGRPFFYERLKELRLVPGHDLDNWEDEVRGRHAAAGFALAEGVLKKRSGGRRKRERVVFRGQVLAIDYPKRFLGRTILLRDAGPFNGLRKPGPEFTRVGLSSPQFEKAFEAWSTDQVDAHALLDPVALERFLELERLFRGKRLRAAFAEGRLYIAIETGDRLNLGTMFAPLANPARVEKILKEFDLVFDLIDVAVRPVDRRMAGAFSLDEVRAG
jgi:hypothetical protein